MRIVRLAQILDLKYGLISEAVNEQRIIAEAKEDILNAFKYHFMESAKGALSKNPKGSIFRTMAEAGDPKMKELTLAMDKLVNHMGKGSVGVWLNSINEILVFLKEIKDDPERTVRNNILKAFRGISEAAMKHHLSRFEDSMKRVFSLLQKSAKKLSILDPTIPVEPGKISAEPGLATQQEIETFMTRTPFSKSYGLDSQEVIEKMALDHEIRVLMTRVINAVNREMVPVDGLAVAAIARQIKARLELLRRTNEGELGREELSRSQWVSPELKQERLDEAAEEAAQQQAEEQNEKARLIPQLQQREKEMEEAKQRQIEEDRERHLGSESQMDVLLVRFSKRYL